MSSSLKNIFSDLEDSLNCDETCEVQTPVESVFAADGPLSTQKGYKIRDGQIAMAVDIEKAMQQKRNLVVEAGTGTGKTYAYLAPIMMSGKKALISTDSKALQDQLYKKDIKRLANMLKRNINVQILKGFDNYVCIKNLLNILEENPSVFNVRKQKDDSDLLLNAPSKRKKAPSVVLTEQQKVGISDFLQKTSFGEVSDLQKYFENNSAEFVSKLRSAVVTTMNICPSSSCSHCKECYFMKARERAKQADILILNHALFCCGAKSPIPIFPSVDICVFDEGHKLPERVRSSFSTQVSRRSIIELLNLIAITFDVSLTVSTKKNKTEEEDLEKDSESKFKETLIENLEKIMKYSLTELHGGIDNQYTDDSFHLKEGISEMYVTTRVQKGANESDFYENLNKDKLITAICSFLKSIGTLYKNLQQKADTCLNPEKKKSITNLVDSINNVGQFFKRFCPEFWKKKYEEDNYYRWYQLSADNFIFYVSPISPAEEFKRYVLANDRFLSNTFVFTSATLSTLSNTKHVKPGLIERGNYESFSDYLGMLGLAKGNTDVLLVDSPFDYQNNALLCIPNNMPKGMTPKQMIDLLTPTINQTPGGIFILCTSNHGVEQISHEIRGNTNIAKRRIFVQSVDCNRNLLIEKFKDDGRGILIGTKSFWEGVDIQGSALSLVIIDKLPFPQKSIELAAEEKYYLKINNAEQSPFKAFLGVDLPKAVIDLKQGVGRLLRSEDDCGVVILCAPTLTEANAKSYRVSMLNALPNFKRTENLADITEFWKNKNLSKATKLSKDKDCNDEYSRKNAVKTKEFGIHEKRDTNVFNSPMIQDLFD